MAHAAYGGFKTALGKRGHEGRLIYRDQAREDARSRWTRSKGVPGNARGGEDLAVLPEVILGG